MSDKPNKKMGRPIKVPPLTGHPERDLVIMIRKATGWTNKQLGNEVGVSESAVRAWATGQRRPTGSALILLKNLTTSLDQTSK